MAETITIANAQAHEALYVKVAALTRLANGIAARNPLAPVPDDVRVRAEGLLLECRRFARRDARRRGIEPAAPAYGGFAVQLGGALAALDYFEARNTYWDSAMKCVAWRVADKPRPVRRLNPKPLAVPISALEDRERKRNHLAVLRRIDEKVAEAYGDGYADGIAGRPMSPPVGMAERQAEIMRG